MMSRHIIPILLLIVVLHYAFPARAGHDTDIKVFSKNAYSVMTQINVQDPDGKETAVDQFKKLFGFASFYDRVTQDLTRDLTQDQHQKLLHAFEAVFFANFKKNLEKIITRKIERPTYSLRQESGIDVVDISGNTKEGSLTLSLFIGKSGEAYKVCDIAVDSILLSRNYRGSFNRIHRRDGFEALVEKLETRLEKIQQD